MIHPAQHFAWCNLHISSLNKVIIYSPLLCSFPSFKPIHCSMSGSNCLFLTCIQVSQGAGNVAWYSHLFKIFLQFVVIYAVKGFSIVNEAGIYVSLGFSCFFCDPTNVVNFISDSSVFLNPTCAPGSSWFMYCWCLAWTILSITLLTCEMSTIVQ